MPIPEAQVKSFRCDTRYGYAWVALDDPLLPIPDPPETHDPAIAHPPVRRTLEHRALRMMENSFDNAHFSFVHKSLRRSRTSRGRSNTS